MKSVQSEHHRGKVCVLAYVSVCVNKDPLKLKLTFVRLSTTETEWSLNGPPPVCKESNGIFRSHSGKTEFSALYDFGSLGESSKIKIYMQQRKRSEAAEVCLRKTYVSRFRQTSESIYLNL